MTAYDLQVDALPLPVESRQVSTAFGASHVLVMGPPAAPPLVVLHGWSGKALAMRPLFAPLAESHRVYAPDIIGQGGKSAAVRPAPGGFVTWLGDLLDALGLERVNLIGISGSGWLAQQFAADQPARIVRLVLLSSGGLVTAGPATIARMLAVFLPAAVRPSPARARRFVAFSAAPGWAAPPEIVDDFYRMFRDFRPLTQPPRMTDAALARLTMPTLLLMGAHDRIFPAQAVVARAQARIPGLQAAEILPQAGHLIVDEASAAVALRVKQFLAGGAG
jgi:pimeloyl-ACP methyl ester carboxylesterase